ncbi:MAG TPA: universal stress protein [Deltaproteobacteria bacterium]|nr:universal stress protein [Deltaproteobacteria bacterium]
MFTPQKILVPTDFSPSSGKALEKALDMAEQYHSKVILLHVIDEVIRQCAGDYCLSQEDVMNLQYQSEKCSREMLENEVNGLKEKRAVEIEYDLQWGSPVEVIIGEQQKTGSDLIVLGSHGKKTFKEHLIGSVTDKVVRTSKAPVMVVHA